jgi:flagellin-like protein
MKGITPIISIIVLLLITISLAGAAYVFLGGYMTAYTGRAVQATGICVGGTEAYITVTNMGSLPVQLTNCALSADSRTYECDDLTVVRTDGGQMSGTFSANVIQAAEPDRLYKVTFTDTTCAASGVPDVCKYAFTRAGELQPVEVSVSCGG